MAIRKLLLPLILWSLGIGAVLGAVAILTNGSSVIWRVSGTTVLTALAAGVLIPMFMLMDRPAGRAAGMLGTIAVVEMFFLTLLLIWNLAPLLPARRGEEAAGMTIGFTLLCAPPAMLFLRIVAVPEARIAALTGIGVAGLTFLLFMIPTWLGMFVPRADEWLRSAFATGALGLLLAGCLIQIDGARPPDARLRPLRFGGATAAAIALVIALWAIWNDVREDNGALTSIISIAVVVTHANLCWLVPLTPAQRWIRAVTVAMGVCTALLVDLLAIVQDRWSDDIFASRLAGACGFVTACGSLALLFLARLNRKMYEPPRPFTQIQSLTLICPGCERKQQLAIGTSNCPDCRLAYHIRVEEPHCPQCDYLLFRLAGDRCPECGVVISEIAPAPAGP